MALRDFAIFLIAFSLLPLCLARPYVGVLLYSWFAYMNPHRLTWALAYDFPFAQVIAVITLIGLVGLILRRDKSVRLPWERETRLLVSLWAMFVISTFFSLRPDLAWLELQDLSKILLMTFVTIALIDDKKKLRYLFLVIALSLGFYGFKGGVFAIVRGGEQMVFGPPGSFIADNTALGLGLNMALPIIFYLAKTEPNRWLKRFLYLTFLMTILAILFTYSRGAFLGLAVVLGLLFLDWRGRAKVAVVLISILLVPVALTVVPQKWIDRMGTITNYQADSSAMKRITAWKTAWSVALNHPLTGGGFQIIDDPQIGNAYNPSFTESDAGVHSIYFEVLAENGFIALAIFVSLMLSSIFGLRRVRRILQKERSGSEATGSTYEFVCYSRMLEISLIAYAVSGFFLEFASFELFYQTVGLVIIVKTLARKEMAADVRDKKEREAVALSAFSLPTK